MTKNILTAIFDAIASVFRHLTHRSELKNAADVKQAKERQNDIDSTNEIEQAVKNKDTKKMQEILAE